MYKLLFKYKGEMLSILIALLLVGINAYNYINQSIIYPVFPIKGVNAFSFWYYVRSLDIGEVLVFLMPILIILFATSFFFKELSSGMYKNIMIRTTYFKYCFQRILIMYFKAIIYIVMITLLVFLVGKQLLTDKIIVYDSPEIVLLLPNFQGLNPYLFVLITIVCNCLFAMTIVNVAVIVALNEKKQHLQVVISLIVIMFINYGIFFTLYLVSSLLKKLYIINFAEAINIFGGYIPDVNYKITLASLIIWLVVSLIVMIKLLSKKQRMFDLYE